VNKYDEQLPVTRKWAEAHEGEQWTFTMFVFLDDLIEMSGYDEMNEMCDDVTGVTMVDLGYMVVQVPPDTVDGTFVCIEATGTIDL
jgi:hypothetical protein